MPTSVGKLLAGIDEEHILAAIALLDKGATSRFADSTRFDVLYLGRRYPPKEVAGLALEALTKTSFGPKDFKGGKGSACFNAIERCGFDIVSKPKALENDLSFTRFLDSLGCHLRIGWYWSAKSEDETRVIFTIWSDHLKGDKYVLLPSENLPWTSLPGAHEMRKHIPIAERPGVEVLGVYCHARDTETEPRERAYYDDKSLLVLKVENIDGATVATVLGEVDVDVVRAGWITGQLIPPQSAMEDLDQLPPGVERPERTVVTVTPFKRDQMVREYVLQRANGRCEYCDQQGFLMPNGRRYLEAHHIVALSCEGPDTVNNLIALCPSHHREAHFGTNAEVLNATMLDKLKVIASIYPL
jgi:5-methylcytosine-specific restriction protein A